MYNYNYNSFFKRYVNCYLSQFYFVVLVAVVSRRSRHCRSKRFGLRPVLRILLRFDLFSFEIIREKKSGIFIRLVWLIVNEKEGKCRKLFVIAFYFLVFYLQSAV